MMQIRFEKADHSERPAIIRLWQASFEERGGEGIPDQAQIEAFSTLRFLLLHDGETLVGIAGVTLPADHARFYFENDITFPHEAIPSRLRSQVAEGLGLYINPAYRRYGAAHMLTFLTLLIAVDAGAITFVSQNANHMLRIALAAGFVNTGIATKVRKEHTAYLTVGELRQVCAASYQRAAEVVDMGLSEELAAMLARWREQN